MLLTSGNLFDGRRWLGPTDIRVEGDRIAGVARKLAPEGAERVVSLNGTWVVPGLIDAHLHLFPGFLRRLPAFGVTTAVDMFATPRLLARLNAEAGSASASSFITAGTGATAPGGHPCQLAAQGLYEPFAGLTDPRTVESFVEARIAEGASFIKAFVEDGELAGRSLPTLDIAVLRALCEVAHDRGLRVIAHALTPRTARTSVLAGVDGLAHVPVPGADPKAAGELIELLIERGVFVISTLCALASLLGGERGHLRTSSRLSSLVSPTWRKHLEIRGGNADRDAWHRTLDLTAALAGNRVPVVAGTDAAFPGVVPGHSVHMEAQLLHDCGMSPLDVLSALTSRPAEILGLHDAGRVERGSRADLLILDQDPTANVTHTQEIAATVVKGHVVYHSGGSYESRNRVASPRPHFPTRLGTTR